MSAIFLPAGISKIASTPLAIGLIVTPMHSIIAIKIAVTNFFSADVIKNMLVAVKINIIIPRCKSSHCGKRYPAAKIVLTEMPIDKINRVILLKATSIKLNPLKSRTSCAKSNAARTRHCVVRPISVIFARNSGIIKVLQIMNKIIIINNALIKKSWRFNLKLRYKKISIPSGVIQKKLATSQLFVMPLMP